MSTPENIRNKAYSAARQLVRNRLAESAGAEYEKLGPSDKINVDRAVEKKTDHIKKIALKLIPQIANHEKKRVDSFHKGTTLTNYGSPEKDDLHEALNKKFASKVDSSQKKKKEDTKGGKNPHIQMHNTFGEEVALDSAVYKAIAKKAEKSGVDITTLGEVYNRGMSIWYEDTNVSQQQYAFARVNSFINKGKTYFNEDNDLLAENFGDEYHVLYVNKKPATKYRTPNDAKKDMDYLSKNHPDVHLQLKKVSTSISEATYKGKDVPLNKPMAGDVKKSKVYVDPDGDGKAQKVNFGDKTLSIKKNNPDRKKSYCARSGGQGNLNDKTSANYWSRKAWNCEEVEIDDENTLELTQEEMNFFVENGVQFELVEATIRNTKKLIQRLHDRGQGQTYGGRPYSVHPKSVMRLGIKVFGGKRFDQNARKAALLHDTIEDTPTSPETLAKKGFHPDVVKAVQLLSKDKTKSYEGNIENIASGKTPAHNYAKMVKYVDNMSNYLETPKPEWNQDRVETQKGKYMRSMERLGGELGVDHHTKLNPKWKMKTEEVSKSNPSNREEGTDKLTKIYKKDTPGQSSNIDELFSSRISNMDESVRSGETHGVIVPAHTIVSQKTGQSITIPAKTKNVKKNDVILNKGDNPFDGK